MEVCSLASLKIRSLFAALIVAALLAILSFSFLRIEEFPYHESLRLYLKDYLAETREIKSAEEIPSMEKSVIYVLGGSPYSLRYRFRVAADLYSRGIAERIIVLSRPGITEYEMSLNRNLTNNEWSLKTLDGYGVEAGDVEFMRFDDGFFGTLGESKAVAALVRKRGVKTLILVSSLPHTRRVLLSFSKALEGADVKLFVYGSNDPVGLTPLFKEWFKILVYRHLLLN